MNITEIEWMMTGNKMVDNMIVIIANIFFSPSSFIDFAICVCSFFASMMMVCSLVEFLNDRDGVYTLKKKIESLKDDASKNKEKDELIDKLTKRIKQIKEETMESFFAVASSTVYSLLFIKYIFPLRYGHTMKIFPDSPVHFVLESLFWLIVFEFSAYFLHRFMHWTNPINIYVTVINHKQHHLFIQPTCFAAQAIHPVEAVAFASASLVGCMIYPISTITQYVCGYFLLCWSIMAHDTKYRWDHSFHYIHHTHVTTNYGFIGFVDVLFNSVYWGSETTKKEEDLGYIPRLQRYQNLISFIPWIKKAKVN